MRAGACSTLLATPCITPCVLGAPSVPGTQKVLVSAGDSVKAPSLGQETPQSRQGAQILAFDLHAENSLLASSPTVTPLKRWVNTNGRHLNILSELHIY